MFYIYDAMNGLTFDGTNFVKELHRDEVKRFDSYVEAVAAAREIAPFNHIHVLQFPS